MIKKLFCDDNIAELKMKSKSFNDIINDLENDDKEFYVGVDYAGVNSHDKSMVSTFKRNNDGSYEFLGTREFNVDHDTYCDVVKY